MISSSCHLLHLLTYLPSTCSSPPPSLSCLCISHTTLWQGGELVYPGLGCDQLQEYLPPLMVFLVIINILICILSLFFMFIITYKKCNHRFANWRSPVRDESFAPMINNNQGILSLEIDK